MQWVETTGKTIDEAKGLALDQLGVAEDDAEFEILVEPKSTLFGLRKAEARIRARVKPTMVRPKLENRDRRKARETAKAAKQGKNGSVPKDLTPELSSTSSQAPAAGSNGLKAQGGAARNSSPSEKSLRIQNQQAIQQSLYERNQL